MNSRLDFICSPPKQNGLKKLLEEKKCFKLICGAGNENLEEVEKLVALYAKAGCRFFDLCASEEVLKSAQKGLDFAIPKDEQKDYHFCVSVGTENDPHFNKVTINQKDCKRCEKCIKICPQNAISQYFKVIEKNCIGCLKCQKVCKHDAILTVRLNPHPTNSLLFTLYSLLSCIELHVSDETDAEEKWDYLCKNFDGMLSICIGRDKFSNERILSLIKRLVENREPYTMIIQADGSPMSGGEDDFNTTLQAVAMAELIQSANLPVYLTLSGGTNSKTAELAKLCGVDFRGVAVGSYARKIVKEYIEREDFWTNKAIFEETSKIAAELINSTLHHIEN
ncbi:MAG: LdpA C-terminal domain-containing domain [bacterium]